MTVGKDRRRPVVWPVVVPFAVSGVLHLVKPQVFEAIIPAPLRPWARELVYASGVAEIACAVGLLADRSRPVAATASAALLIAVWPANLQMAMDAGRRALQHGDAASISRFVVTLARLPLQVPLVRVAWRARGRPMARGN